MIKNNKNNKIKKVKLLIHSNENYFWKSNYPIKNQNKKKYFFNKIYKKQISKENKWPTKNNKNT